MQTDRCSNCGYVQPVYHSVDEKIAAAAPMSTVPLDNPQGGLSRSKLFLLGGAAVFILLAGLMGFQQVQAASLLSSAQALSQQHKYAEAYDMLKQAAALWSFPPTKQSINDTLDQTTKWKNYQTSMAEATELITEGKFDEAISLLQSIESDYPDYQAAKDLLASAENSQGGKVATLPQTGDTTTPSPTPSATPTTSPKPSSTSKPKSSSPTQSSPPSYIVTNSYCRIDTTQATDLYQVAVNMASACQTVFPQIVQRLSAAPTSSPHTVTLTNSGFSNGAVAYTNVGAGTVTVAISYMRDKPTDMGLMVHELTHVVQGYVNVNVPGWMVEGMADYMRYALGYSTSWSYSHCGSGERYTSGYGCSAAFLKYVERVYPSFVIKDLHNTIRQNNYTDAYFISKTGKTLEQLYAGCRASECSGGAA